MKVFLILSIVVLGALADEAQDREDEAKWVQFKNVHGKQYHHSEESKRKARFIERDRKIKLHNSGNPSFKMAHNKFSDLSDEERGKLLGAVVPPVAPSRNYEQFYADISEDVMRQCSVDNATVDYRLHRCMGPVKNQGQCGSCWSFAATAPLEFSKCNKTGAAYVSISEQQLVDCDKNDGGCNGGWYSTAWDYLKTAGGSNPTSLYAYTAVGGTCKFLPGSVVNKVSSYGRIPSKDVNAIKAALKQYGPLAVAMQVQSSFYSYSTGIYADATCPTNGAVNHAITLVGFGDGFWIARNSWGASWGDKGYFKIKMGVNMCSIEHWAYYVVAA